MTEKDQIDAYLSITPHASSTIAAYKRILNQITTDIPDLSTLTAIQLKAWLDRHTTWGTNMRWQAYAAIRSYMRYQYGNHHPALALRIRREETPRQRSLTRDQITDLFNHFDTTPKGIRDRAILALALDAGLRCSEICCAELRHLDLHNQTGSCRIKGGKQGDYIFSEQTGIYLAEWITIRQKINPSSPTLFCNIRTGKRLTTSGLKAIIKKWGKNINLTLSPHDLRRTFATLSIQSGAPTRLVQVAGRWQSIGMVLRYTRGIELQSFRPWFIIQPAQES